MKTIFGTGSVTLAELAAFCDGKLKDRTQAKTRVSAICTDSREVDPQTAFFTLPGARDDGETHLAEVAARGCPCAICRSAVESPVCAITTPDRIYSLLQLAKTIREKVDPRCVAVTGSAGKTTTKEFISAVLSQKWTTFKTSQNHNSLIGMPLSLLEMEPDVEWAVLEMGMNAAGEIKALSELAKPEIAAITNIGTAHIGMLGSQKAILQAKLEIFSGLRPNGVFLLNADDELLSGAVGKNFRTISLSANGRKADFSAKNIRVEPQKTIFDLVWQGGKETDLCLTVSGKQFVLAALFAFAVGIYADVAPEDIRKGLLLAKPGKLRQETSTFGGITLIEDCYNASPESVSAALETLECLCKNSGKRSVAVLGDMLELGNESERLHYTVGERIAKKGIDLLFTVGEESRAIAQGAIKAGFPPDHAFGTTDPRDLSELLSALQTAIRPGDVVLIKASRKIAAERIGSALKDFLQKREGRDHA